MCAERCFENTLVLQLHDFGTVACSKRRTTTPSCRRAALDVCGAAVVAVGPVA